MISPLQLEEHQLFEVDFRVHDAYEPPEERAPHNLVLQARGETLEVSGEEVPPYIRISVATYYTLLDQSEEALAQSDEAQAAQASHIVLALDVNRGEEDELVTPYSLRLVIGGLFRAYGLPVGEERELALRVVRANGSGLLYGIARQLAKSLTLQSGRPGLMLPSLSFRDVVEYESGLEGAESAEGD